MYYYNVEIKCNIITNGTILRECVKNARSFKKFLIWKLNDYYKENCESFGNLSICFEDCSWFLKNENESKRLIVKMTFNARITSNKEEDADSFNPIISKLMHECVNAGDVQVVITDKESELDIDDILQTKLDELSESDEADDYEDYTDYMDDVDDELEHVALTDNEPTKETVEAKSSVENAEEKLNNMIGLKDVKNVIKELVASARVRKMREKIGLPVLSNSMHMIYTGNPGTAKTTVASLLAGILHKYGIIKENKFIECGRSSLIGEFVGHTAPKVKAKFDAAAGAILFIDEAYSLVGEGKDFGDEAITTIVQEMENHRSDVIVIFAGYPDRMEEFLDKNDGLRSRISYHLNFPDYNEIELLQILNLMIKENGYLINAEVSEKCLGIFREAKGIKNFGNGRFVRNMFEQAVTQQALRITEKMGNKLVSKKQLMQLEASDFKQTLVQKKNFRYYPQIGFDLIGPNRYSKDE